MEKAGYRWIGFDYQHPNAPLWADAHAMPFPDNSFDFVISLAVLEHIKHPPVMLREIRRILKPGGLYLGSVAYLVPFHDWASYFNMTHHGVWSSMEDAGLEAEFVFGDRRYQGIRALAMVGLFAGLRRNLAYAIVEPIVWLHRLYWNIRRWKGSPDSSRDWQSLLNTGAFVYRARKPESN
jgi:SAM-dependent methyltransferase